MQRVFSQEPSGRAFIQKLMTKGRWLKSFSLFFEALKSKRRLRLCTQVSLQLYEKAKLEHKQNDPFIHFKELDGYDLYAGDGHYHAAAVHDVKKSDKKYGTQHFYCIDLRSHALRHLALADTIGTRKKEHDMRALKRQNIETLRQGACKGRKVVYVWDRAGIDFLQWYKWKHKGIYFVSQEKENIKLMVIGKLDYDPNDPINAGVVSYEIVGCSAGVSICRVGFECPISGMKFNFITSLMNLSPGLIAYLYKTRWDIEKIFDDVKNKLVEKKAWASSETAKTMQAQFICLAHNLTLLFKELLEKERGVKNNVENRRRQKRLLKVLSDSKANINKLPFFLTTAKRSTQRSVKFIRWLRHNLFSTTSWMEAADCLRRIYAVF